MSLVPLTSGPHLIGLGDLQLLHAILERKCLNILLLLIIIAIGWVLC